MCGTFTFLVSILFPTTLLAESANLNNYGPGEDKSAIPFYQPLQISLPSPIWFARFYR